MKIKHRILIVEGIDTAGKSSVIIPTLETLCLKQGWKVLHFNSYSASPEMKEKFLQSRHNMFESLLINNHARLLTSKMIESIASSLNEPTVFIIDRWAYSDMAYSNYFDCVDKNTELHHQLFRNVVESGFHEIVGDVVFCGLISDKKHIIERMRERESNDVLDNYAVEECEIIQSNYRRIADIALYNQRGIQINPNIKYIECGVAKDEVIKQITEIFYTCNELLKGGGKWEI